MIGECKRIIRQHAIHERRPVQSLPLAAKPDPPGHHCRGRGCQGPRSGCGGQVRYSDTD